MNNVVYNKMVEYMKENKGMRAWFTNEEWSSELEINITPQRLGAMYRAGLLEKQDVKNDKYLRRYYGDNKNRYMPIR